MDHFANRSGSLHAEDVPLTAIAEAVGTPVYVYSVATMKRHAEVMLDAVAGCGSGEPLVAYAVKANPNGAVLRVLQGCGLGADVVSIGEYRRARAAGIAPERIVFSGVGKTAEEMAEALAGGVLQFNAESIEEARMLSAIADAQGKSAPIGFRINPDVEAGTHAKITTGTADNKFGIPAAEALGAYAEAERLPGLKVQGITVHIGSQLVSIAPLEAAFRRLGELIGALRAQGSDIRLADLGGGLGVPHGADQPQPALPEAYGAMVRRVTADWNCRLVFEPGRLIVGNAGVLLTRVVRVKPGASHPWLIVDAGMNDLMRPALYDAWHGIEAVTPRGAKATVNVVGPVCESGDTFAMAREMDAVEAGDLVLFRTAGAYGATMANGYNSRPLTPEVLVDGDRWALVRKRIDLSDCAEVDPDWR
ncbi:diaminopimelate decarboxylase [Sphingomonas rosea]|uniref:Diaminopimelate decarboxylase n=1 Tax=Sphingomonas rosea TaxID=335605 RepID=A0ABP7TWA3_9SPHN